MTTRKKPAAEAVPESPPMPTDVPEPPPKQLAIFIDGANLWNMSRFMGIGKTDFRFLYKLLTSLGDPPLPLAQKPVYTTNSQGQAKVLEILDFEPIVTETTNGTDDKVLIQRIEALDPEVVGRVVLVSGDGDFYKTVDNLVEQGVEVWIVATKVLGREGRPMLSSSLYDPEKFHFVELADYKDSLMLAPFVPRHIPEAEDIPDGVQSPVPTPAPPPPVIPSTRIARLEIELPEELNGLDSIFWNNVVSKIAGVIHTASIGGLKTTFSVDPNPK